MQCPSSGIAHVPGLPGFQTGRIDITKQPRQTIESQNKEVIESQNKESYPMILELQNIGNICSDVEEIVECEQL